MVARILLTDRFRLLIMAPASQRSAPHTSSVPSAPTTRPRVGVEEPWDGFDDDFEEPWNGFDDAPDGGHSEQL